MKVIFLGVGEAFDETLPNTSLLVKAQTGVRQISIMLDCGFTAPPSYWRHASGQEELDALWVSHFHGDHFFGVPALFVRFWEAGRRKPLTIVGQSGIEDRIIGAMNLAYPNFLAKLAFPLEFVTVEAGETREIMGVQWRFAENGHGQRDLSVRIGDGKASVFYSGDGSPTPETLGLAQGCSLIAHEAFKLENAIAGHGTIQGCIDFARRAGAGTLALVHVQRDERRERRQDIMRLIGEITDLKVILPEPGDAVEL